MSLMSSKLWIIATSIGNYEDISPRARRILSEADIILAEDTRRALKLLKELKIKPPKLISFFEHNEEERISEILQALSNGAVIALISDAGTPLISDPGYSLVRAARHANFEVKPIPGPSAPIAALSAAGIPPIPFTFLGFLPRGKKGRIDLFTTFAELQTTLCFFERKDRLKESLKLAFSILGKREIAICRELTKIHEEIISDQLNEETINNLQENNLLGEITVILGPPCALPKASEKEVEKLLLVELNNNIKPKQAAINIKSFCPGWTVKEIYQYLLKMDK